MLSKLTTHSVGTPSASGESSSSDTSPRWVLVRAATTTDAIRSATGSRVNTSTGLSPPGVLANQTSPRCIEPIRPIFGGTPVRDFGQARLICSERPSQPCLHVIFSSEPYQVSVKSLP